jgi:hypothetical protein
MFFDGLLVDIADWFELLREHRQGRIQVDQVPDLCAGGRGEADSRDATRWCVGLAIDPKLRHIYWSQKGPDNAGLGRGSAGLLSIEARFTVLPRGGSPRSVQ